MVILLGLLLAQARQGVGISIGVGTAMFCGAWLLTLECLRRRRALLELGRGISLPSTPIIIRGGLSTQLWERKLCFYLVSIKEWYLKLTSE